LTLNNLAGRDAVYGGLQYFHDRTFAILVRMKDFSLEGLNGLARQYPVVPTAAIFYCRSWNSAYRGFWPNWHDSIGHANQFLSLAGDFACSVPQ
jgi:hypothetical protein